MIEGNNRGAKTSEAVDFQQFAVALAMGTVTVKMGVPTAPAGVM
jgi:hypothetical protein